MTVSDVRKRLADIAASAGDDEGAHSMEDKLRADVLTAISYGIGDPPEELATAVLESANIDFARWCA